MFRAQQAWGAVECGGAWPKVHRGSVCSTVGFWPILPYEQDECLWVLSNGETLSNVSSVTGVYHTIPRVTGRQMEIPFETKVLQLLGGQAIRPRTFGAGAHLLSPLAILPLMKLVRASCSLFFCFLAAVMLAALSALPAMMEWSLQKREPQQIFLL